MLHIWRHKYISDVAHDIALRILNHLTSILHAYDFRSQIHHRCNLCWVWSHHSICGSAVLTVATLGLSPQALLGGSQLASTHDDEPATFPYFISISIHSRHIDCDVRYAPHLPIFPHMTWVDPRNWLTDSFPRVSCVWKSRRSEGESNPSLMRESSESYLSATQPWVTITIYRSFAIQFRCTLTEFTKP